LFPQYFVKRWESQEIPEYDLETDELVYKNAKGVQERREPFNWVGKDNSGTGEHLLPDQQQLDAAVRLYHASSFQSGSHLSRGMPSRLETLSTIHVGIIHVMRRILSTLMTSVVLLVTMVAP
jgi:hypothetical protein